MIHPRPLSFFLALAVAASAARAASPTIAAAGAAVRDRDGKVDVAGTLDRLTSIRADEFLYDLPAGSEAWSRLPAFADEAKRRGVNVYVYLAPWTLARRNEENRQDGPFGTDYVAWCEAIGKLAADHPAIVGVVIDDFASNVGPERFTPAMLREMRDALNASAAGRLKLLPVLYFSLPLAETLETFGPQFGDGAILAYPRSRREIEVANANLRDLPRGASFGTSTPRRKKLRPGQGVFARTTLNRAQGGRAAKLTFFVNDQNATEARGRHHLVVRIDGREAWRREVAAESLAEDVSVDLPDDGRPAVVEVGVISDEPSEETIVHIAFDDVSLRDSKGERLGRIDWAESEADGMEIGIVQQRSGERRWSIPMTLLVAGAAFQHEKRFDEPGTPARIAGKFGEALGWARDGEARGVIAWFLPLDDAKGSRAIVDAVAAKATERR